MIDWNLTLWLGTLSGVAFILLGTLAMFHPRHRLQAGLPLFFMTWGAQLVATNVAPLSPRGTAFMLFWLAKLFLPLQVLLLLHYVHQQTPKAGLRATCRVLGILAVFATLIGLVASVAAPSQGLTVIQRPDGKFQQQLGNWGTIFNDTQLIGITLSLLLLAFTTPSSRSNRHDWLLLVGLSFAWASSVTFNLVYEGRLLLQIFEWTALAGLLLLPLLLMAFAWRGEPSMRLRHGSLALVIYVSQLLWLAPHATGNLAPLLAAGAGLFRLASLALLLPAVLLHPANSKTPSRARAAPIWVATAAALANTVILALAAAFPHLDSPLLIGASGLGLANLLLIGTVATSEAIDLWTPHAAREGTGSNVI